MHIACTVVACVAVDEVHDPGGHHALALLLTPSGRHLRTRS